VEIQHSAFSIRHLHSAPALVWSFFHLQTSNPKELRGN
jgi:hypothetical protein